MRPGDVRCGQVTLHLEDHMLVEKEADTREVEVEARREVEASLTTPQPLTREDNICKVSGEHCSPRRSSKYTGSNEA